MSARRKGRRHGAVNEATVTTGAGVTGAGEANVAAPATVYGAPADGPAALVDGPAALADGAAVEVAPALTNRAAHEDGSDNVRDAGELGSSANATSRREPRVRVQAPVPLSAAPAAPEAPALTLGDGSETRKAACTLAQMRRFIKSRPYIPVHELRRRFLIEGDEDDVNAVSTEQGTVYVGLPASEARFLADLIKAGEVGCELLLDPTSPAVVGVYAMRPVSRQ